MKFKIYSAVTEGGCTIILYHTCAEAEAFRKVHYERGGDKDGLGAVGEWVVVQYDGKIRQGVGSGSGQKSLIQSTTSQKPY